METQEWMPRGRIRSSYTFRQRASGSPDSRSPWTVTRHIGEILVECTRLEPAQLERTLRLQPESGQRLGILLVSLGLIAERELAEALAEQLGLDLVPSHAYGTSPVAEGRIAPEFLRQVKAVPLAECTEHVVVAMCDPLDQSTVEALRLALGRPVMVQVGVITEIEAAIERQYTDDATSMEQIAGAIEEEAQHDLDDVQRLRDLASEAPVIRKRCGSPTYTSI